MGTRKTPEVFLFSVAPVKIRDTVLILHRVLSFITFCLAPPAVIDSVSFRFTDKKDGR